VAVKLAFSNLAAPLHLEDPRHYDNENFDLVLIGEGDVPVTESRAAVAGPAWEGSVSAESEKRRYPNLAEPEVALLHHSVLLRRWPTGRSA
jgi:hypothetical protein